MTRNKNQKKSGGQGKDQDRNQNRRQSGTQAPGNDKDQKNQRPGNELSDDRFDSVLPSYGSFLKDMQYEDDWGGNWDDDDTPIEKKVAAQKAEKAKAQKKKQVAAQPAVRERQQQKQQTQKSPEKSKPQVHEDERLFNNEDDRGLMPDDLELSAERKAQSAEIAPTSRDSKNKKASQKQVPQKQEPQKQVPQKQEPQKQVPKDKAAQKPASVAQETVAEPSVVASVEAISKGGGVSLRVVASKSAMPPSNRRKRAERGVQSSESRVQGSDSRKQNEEKRPDKQKLDNIAHAVPKKDEPKAKLPAAPKQPYAESKLQRNEPKKDVKQPEKPTPKPSEVRESAERKTPDSGRKPQDTKKESPGDKGKIDKTSKPRESQGDAANDKSKPRVPNVGGHGVTALPSKSAAPPFKLPPMRAAIESAKIASDIEDSDADVSDIEGKDKPSGFGNLKLSKVMLASLKAANYHEPSPVQAGTIPDVLAGHDVMGQARTGTGKTAAFVIPILEGFDKCVSGNEPVALILVPTRELAVQVRDEAEKLAKGRKVQIMACYGGKPIVQQITKLKAGADIVVGTPGRVLDLSRRGALKLDALIWVVLDEADRMLDIGFRPDIEKILRLTPSDRQTLLFSATLPPDVVKLAERYMRDPKVIDFSEKQMAVETIEQYYITIDRDRKLQGLICLINEQQPKQAIVFCRTKRGADRVKRQLEGTFASLDSLHGDMVQATRDRVMSQFRSGKLQILVATDVVGRGIDVTGISHIINYDIPVFCDDYVHRVGRTGRMGREGTAYTFVTAEEGQELTRIEMRINQQLKRAELKNFEAVSLVVPDDKEPPKPVFGKPPRRVRRAL